MDCAVEVAMRQAIAESFKVPPLDWCLKGGSAGSGGSGMDRAVGMARIICLVKQGHKNALSPRLVRMTFHDAADTNNLQFKNDTDASKLGGVDACLHTALLS